MNKKLYITRFRKESPVNVVALYRKGKGSNLNVDTIRLLVRDPDFSYIDGEFQLMMPTPVEDAKWPPQMRNGRCNLTGLLMSERPEFMGDLGPLKAYDIDPNNLPEILKQRGRNYYLCDDETLYEAYEILIKEMPCFRVEALH